MRIVRSYSMIRHVANAVRDWFAWCVLVQWACTTCRQQFPSRNKLFAHIKQTKHAAPLAATAGSAATSAGRNKSRKR